MKTFIRCFALLSGVLLSLLSAGCAGKDAGKEKTPPIQLGEFSSEDEKTAFSVAKTFADAFGKALVSGEFKHLEPHLPSDGSGKKFSAPDFAGMRGAMIRIYGKPLKLTYVTSLTQGKLRDMRWKVSFARQDSAGNTGEISEILLCVRIFREPGKQPGIAGFFLKRF